MNARLLAPLLVAGVLAGCSSERTTVTRDAGFDPWVVDAPDLDVLDAGRCTVEKIEDCPAFPGESTLFTAPSGSRVVAVDPPWILLDPLKVTALYPSAPAVTLEARVPEDATLRAVSIAHETYPRQAVYVLGCDATACRVFEVVRSDPGAGLVRTGPELPKATRAIAALEGKIWAAGDGVRRLDGGAWSVERADGRFHAIAADVTSDGPTVAAVGEGGLIAVRAHDEWTAITIGTGETLGAVDLRDFAIAATGERGALYLGTRSGFAACTGPALGARTVSFRMGPGLRYLYGSTDDGRFYGVDAAGSACRSEPMPGQIGAALYMCGVQMNRWRFTASEVVGTQSCAID
ncbi:MAG: hypothetical protein HYV09_24205 [Deltaproteobacteria bacterium]|nr:hypothetical protein [Deltaproteobacteria bacterium]